MVFIPGEEHSVWGSFFSDGAARTLFSSQDFATQVLKWLICVLWHTICLRSVSFQKTLGLNRTAHRNAFITTVFKRTGGPLLIDDFKGFFFSFLAFFFTSRWSRFAFWKVYFVNLLHGKVGTWKLNQERVLEVQILKDWKKRWSWEILTVLLQILWVFHFFFSVKICFFPFCIIVFDYAFILYIFKVDDYLSKPFNLYNKSAE